MTSPAVSESLTPEPSESSAESVLTCALVGNPNCGKTTLFNALTGLKQKVGNYPGVTVEKKVGECFSQHGQKLQIIDLPGAYSLNARSPDEAVLRDVLLGRQKDTPRPDRVICVIDSSNLERNLYLATQVLELGLPTILALNMIDVAESKNLRIDFERLAGEFGVPVIPIQANRKKGLIELKLATSTNRVPKSSFATSIPEEIRKELIACKNTLQEAGTIKANASLFEPLYLISDHDPTHYGITDTDLDAVVNCRNDMESRFPGWEDRLVASRYDAIYDTCSRTVHKPDGHQATITDRLDSFLLHRLWGWATLLGIMGILFYLIFTLAGGPMDAIDSFFNWCGQSVETIIPPGDLQGLIVDGIIAGVGGVVIFLPQILILFFFIGLMEDTGYMARIAFIMDRLMSKVGLNGKSFLPLLSSYACAVPGVMATRTIENPKDRLITILVVPLASCSARLPVYLLMIATIVPSEQVSVFTKVGFMLSMYFIGTLGAFLFAWLFNRGIMKGDSSPMILELPSYRRPSIKAVCLHMWERTRIFIRRAGTIILGISILLWAAATYPKSPETDDPSIQLANSFAGKAGHVIEPLIQPLGYDWKIGIGLVASFAAREVFVSAMKIIYSVEEGDDDDIRPLRDRMLSETRADGSAMYTPLVCLSLMVFYVFAMQCMSTVAIVKRETNSWKWPLFQFAYMTAAAYLAALLVYQVGSVLGF